MSAAVLLGLSAHDGHSMRDLVELELAVAGFKNSSGVQGYPSQIYRPLSAMTNVSSIRTCQ